MNSKTQYINPEDLYRNPAFSQVVTTQGNGKTIYVGGQDALNGQGEIIGKSNLGEQTEQVMKNLQTALAACGANYEHLVKLNIYLVQGQDLQKGFQVSQKYLGSLKKSACGFCPNGCGTSAPRFLGGDRCYCIYS